MKIKTNELQGAALDWAVAKCEGHDMEFFQVVDAFMPSTDWAQGGPIIERHWIELVPWPNESDENDRWQAIQNDLPIRVYYQGPTPLVAAMRCYVASELGDEVEVPNELA